MRRISLKYTGRGRNVENEKYIRLGLQKKFSHVNGYITAFLFIYVLERFTQNADINYMKSMFLVLPLVIVDLLLGHCNYFRTLFVIRALRYVEIFVASFFVSLCSYKYNFGISLILLILLSMEFLASFELLDTYYRVLAVLLNCIPIIIFMILSDAIDVFGFSNNDGMFFSVTFFTGLFIISMFYVTGLYSKLASNYDKKVFEQSRLISNANAMNEALRINQEKVKKANEMLGLQKIKLEAAYNKINNANVEMMIQNEIVKYISSSLEIGKLMALITESILNEIGVDICAIILNAGIAENKQIKYKVRTNLSPQFNQEFGHAIESGCFDDYLLSCKTYVDNCITNNNYSFFKRPRIGSLLIVPLIKEEKQIGLLFVGHPKEDYFVDNTVFFEAIVSQFLIALNNANMYLRMENMAKRDGLTGIFNRGHLTELFNEFLNESIINNSPLTIALFDIDKFKNVNDTYGHLFGDVVIKTIASLSNELAETNGGFVGRYGGEEFVIVFPNKSLKDSYVLVSELHQRIKTTELFHNGESVFVNVSVGITSYPETCKNPADLLNRADWAMYYSKQNGRDRITIDSDAVREEVLLK